MRNPAAVGLVAPTADEIATTREATQKKQALQKWTQFWKVHNRELNSKSDTVVAVAGGIALHGALKTALTRYLIDDHAAAERLFGDEAPWAPLQSTSACIDVGYSLGLYGKDTRSDMKVINKIRNLFAHEIEAIDKPSKTVKRLSFDHDDIKRECSKLKLPDRYADIGPDSETYKTRLNVPVERLRISLTLISFFLIGADKLAMLPEIIRDPEGPLLP